MVQTLIQRQCPYWKRRDTDAEEKPRGDRGRDKGGAATSPGTREPPAAGRSKKDPPQSLQEVRPRDTLISNCWLLV